MLRIGLTGGIGSGKSTVAKIFNILSIPFFDADSVAKKLMVEDFTLQQNIINYFGTQSFINGLPNNAFLAAQVFNNPEKLEKLNALVHPAAINAASKWFAKQNAPYAIKEAALLFEAGSTTGLDYIIGVYAPQELRIQRAIKRSNLTREQVVNRMNQQIDEEIKMRLCDFVIHNDEQHLLIPQVLGLHKKLLT